MFESEGAILSELLRSRSLVGEAQLVEINEEHERTGKPLSQIIVDFGLMSELQLLEALADHLNLEFINLEGLDLTPAILRAMPSSVKRPLPSAHSAGTSTRFIRRGSREPQNSCILHVLRQKRARVVPRRWGARQRDRSTRQGDPSRLAPYRET